MEMRQSWVLYLDFDGVLNNDPYLRHQNNHVPRERHRLFDPQNVAAADFLCRHLPVDAIVVTSSWRDGRTVEELRGLLGDEGFDHARLVASTTPALGDRLQEICEHVKATATHRFIVLDDMQLEPLRRPTFFRTSAARGLTMSLARDIVDLVG